MTEPRAVLAGLRCAAALGMPLSIAGRAVAIPESLCGPCEEAPDDSAAQMELLGWSEVEIARRLAYVMRIAAQEVEALGLGIGLIDPPPSPPASEVATPVRAPARQPEQDPMPPPVLDVQGEIHIGTPAAFAVRSSDAGRSWHVVRLRDNTLLGWHPSRSDAISAGKNAFEAECRRRGPGHTPFTWSPGAAEPQE